MTSVRSVWHIGAICKYSIKGKRYWVFIPFILTSKLQGSKSERSIKTHSRNRHQWKFRYFVSNFGVLLCVLFCFYNNKNKTANVQQDYVVSLMMTWKYFSAANKPFLSSGGQHFVISNCQIIQWQKSVNCCISRANEECFDSMMSQHNYYFLYVA